MKRIYETELPPEEKFKVMCEEEGGLYKEKDREIQCMLDGEFINEDKVKEMINFLNKNKNALSKPANIEYKYFDGEHAGDVEITLDDGRFYVDMKSDSLGGSLEGWFEYLDEEKIPEEKADDLLDDVLDEGYRDMGKWYEEERKKWKQRWKGRLQCDNGLSQSDDFFGQCRFDTEKDEFTPEEYEKIANELEQLSDNALGNVEDIAYDEEELKKLLKEES